MTINFSGSTESCCDHVYVNSIEYDGVLDGIVVGAEILVVEWTSDGSVNSTSASGYGWSAELLCEEVYEGCTLPYAENYDPDANINDGSCILECGYFLSYDSYLDNSNTSNYYCGLYVSQGTYTIEQAINFGYNCDCVILGCTDQNALNFNSEATIDDCSCTYNNQCPSISFTTSDTSIGWQITDLDGEIVLEHNYNNTNGGNYCSNNCFADGCYLINMTTAFNSSSNMFHADGSPSEVDLSLTFQETKLITRDKLYDTGENGLGNSTNDIYNEIRNKRETILANRESSGTAQALADRAIDINNIPE